MTILMKIDQAIRRKQIDPDYITPEDLRNLSIELNTTSNYLNNHNKEFEKIERGVYRRKRETKYWDIEGNEIIMEFFHYFIRIYDNDGNVLHIDKKEGMVVIDLLGNFELSAKSVPFQKPA